MKYVLHNLAKDPSFENVSMWSPTVGTAVADTTIKKYGKQSIKLSGTGSEVYITCTQTSTMVQGHRYYGRVEAYQPTKVGSIDIYWPSAEPMFNTWITDTAGKWNMYSHINTRDNWNGQQALRVDYNNGANTSPTYFDGLVMIDLNADFPDGNYPSKTELDAIPFFESTYTYDDGRITCNNIIVNGSFENDLTNWTISGNISLTTLDRYVGVNSVEISKSSVLKQISTTDGIQLHKYYLSGYFKSNKKLTSTGSKFEWCEPEAHYYPFHKITIENLENYNLENGWTLLSTIDTIQEYVQPVTRASPYTHEDYELTVTIPSNETATILVDGIMVIDLTEAFGVGKEPTKDWCDHNLPKFIEKNFIIEENPTFGVDEHTVVMAHYTSDLDDSSPNNSFEYTIFNNPTLSNLHSKFGLKSLDGTSATHVVAAYKTGKDVLNGDWTLDWWEYWVGTTNTNGYMFITNWANQVDTFGVLLHIVNGTNQLGVYAGNGTGWIYLNAWNCGLTKVNNQWNHKALVHRDGTLYCYQNGILTGSNVLPNFSIGENVLSVNGRRNVGSQYFGGYIEEVRLSDIARWTDNFIPPSNPYREMPAPYNIKILNKNIQVNSVLDKETITLKFDKVEYVDTYEIQRFVLNGEWETVMTIKSTDVFTDIVSKYWKQFQYRIRGVTKEGYKGIYGYSDICYVQVDETNNTIGGTISCLNKKSIDYKYIYYQYPNGNMEKSQRMLCGDTMTIYSPEGYAFNSVNSFSNNDISKSIYLSNSMINVTMPNEDIIIGLIEYSGGVHSGGEIE